MSASTCRSTVRPQPWRSQPARHGILSIVAIPLAAGVLAGQGIVLQPAVGAVLSASTVVVAINAQLLRRATS
jgi:hypothetical protein